MSRVVVIGGGWSTAPWPRPEQQRVLVRRLTWLRNATADHRRQHQRGLGLRWPSDVFARKNSRGSTEPRRL